MVVAVKDAVAMQGGTLVAGITLTLAIINLNKHGLSFDLTSDVNRQKFLNFLGFWVATCGLISLGLNKTGQLYILNDVCIVIIFLGIQLGLCCVMHNTIVRAYLSMNRKSGMTIAQISRWCMAIYPLVLVVLIPIYIGFTQVHEKAVNTSKINQKAFKPLNIALVTSTQLLATISDVVLLRMLSKSMNVGPDVTSNGSSFADSLSAPLVKQYALIWGSVIFDVLIKILIYQGYPVLFDSQISNMTLVFRAQTNLTYGLNLKQMRQSRQKSGSRLGGTKRAESRSQILMLKDEETGAGAASRTIRQPSKSSVALAPPIRNTSKGNVLSASEIAEE